MKKPDVENLADRSNGPPDWQYECLDCGKKFEMPAPRGPSEEKNRSCPECSGKNIKRVGIAKSEVCPPGG